MHADATHGAAQPDENNPTVSHESSDVNVRGVLMFAAGLFVAAVIIHLLIWLLFNYFSAREAARVAPQFPLAAGQGVRLPPEPRLQPSPGNLRTPREDLAELRKHEEQILTSYGWVDKNTGVVRIPIDEAMRLTLERGLPARPQNGQAGSEKK